MPVGEDVDFVWSLHAQGWLVRYEPAARVAHEHRTTLAAWLWRRFEYGLSAAPLARRHPLAVAPVVVPLWSAAVWALVTAGRPRAGSVVIAVMGFRLRRRLSGIPGSGPLTVRLVVTGTAGAGALLAAPVTRAWLPAVGIAAVRSASARRLLLVTWLLPSAAEWWRRPPALDPALRARTLARRRRPLLRRLGRLRARTRSRPADPAIKHARIPQWWLQHGGSHPTRPPGLS
jgi:hypothetical protein